ncbi:MAG: N-acetyltransferase [Rickettsiales bacterium]|jgi:amino-acid N-acetyltransferase|nr:N-acetyltransferase [Rickettsiales bacterium]
MIRQAKISDSKAILDLVNSNANKGLMLGKSPYQIYRNISSFLVYENDGQVVGCARLSVLWKDIAEVCSLAVNHDHKLKGIGRALVNACLDQSRSLGIFRVFALTYECEFFTKCGFTAITRDTLPYKAFGECMKCPKVECCDEHAFIIDLN